MLFVFDTSGFRVLQHYFPTPFRSFWTSFDELVANGEVVSVREVYKELETQITKAWLRTWLKTHRSLFQKPTAAESAFVAKIFSVPHFRQLVGKQQLLKGMPVADPFVIACAKSRDGCVVTEESHRDGGAKIPNVCARFSIECVSVEGFLDKQGWSF